VTSALLAPCFGLPQDNRPVQEVIIFRRSTSYSA